MSQSPEPEQQQQDGQHLTLLIVGMARSGTTVVQRLLSELEGVWVPPETHFWRHAPALASRFPIPLDTESAREAIEWFLSLESSAGLAIDVPDVVDRLGSESYLWDLFGAITASLAPSDAQVLGEKTPDHARWAAQLMNAIPQLVVIGVVRDPREVFRSHLTVPWGLKDPWAFAEKWLEHSRTLEDLLRLFPERTKVTRYEDLVADPETFRLEAARLIGLDLADAEPDIESIDSERLFAPGEWWKAQALQPVESMPARWMDELSEAQIGILQWRLESAMEGWGYELVGPRGLPPTPASDALYSIRSAAARAAAVPLPINASTMAAWQNSDQQRLRGWKVRAEQVNADLKVWQDQARQVGTVSADLTKRNKDLESRVASLSLQVDNLTESTKAWRSRAEELNQDVSRLREWAYAEKIQHLKYKRQRLIASGKLNRLQARRWWKLGAALGRWRRRPYRIDLLLRDTWRLGTGSNPLPPMPDTTRIDEQLGKLIAEGSVRGSPEVRALSEAREAYESGEYERCLEIIDALDPKYAMSTNVQLLSRSCYIKLGEITKAIGSVRLALVNTNDRSLRRQVRILTGRLRETDVNWLPNVGQPAKGSYIPRPDSVLHILKESLPFFERGYTMRSHTTLMAQKQSGFDPTVVTSLGFPRNQGFENFEMEEVIDGVVHHRLDLGSSYTTKTIPYDQILSDQATLTARLAQDIKPAVIQAGSGYRGYETALVGLALARYLSVPMIYEIRSFLEHTWTGDFHRSEQGEYYRRRHAQEKRCLQDADFVITIAEAMRDEIIGRGVAPEKIAVIPNVVDVERFQPRAKSESLVKKYGLSGRPVLGYVSNLGAREGIDNLIRAVAILRDSGLDACGLVVGDGPERDMLAGLVEELDLERHFVLTGHVPNEQIENYYALIDLFVVPRIDDRAARLVTPLKPLEAMAMEIPVVAADLPALRELVSPGERGEVFVPGDPHSLAEVARTVLNSDGLRQRFSSRSKEWLLAERTLESNAARYQDILKRVIEGV